ncbi:MAG: hypothetical protein AMXMBFR56_79800 [Polyangiaceae bacterium]
MWVVLDANVFCADYHLAGSAFRVFLDSLRRLDLRCRVPEVVLEEVLARRKRELDEIARQVKKSNRSWRRITGTSLGGPTADELDANSEEYARVLARAFQEHDIVVVPYPEVSHDFLVKKAVQRRKPFKQSGDGYRDALIWASVVSLAQQHREPLAFVTNNKSDFGTTPNLHHDLVAELEPGAQVSLYNSLEQFNADRVLPNLKHLENVLREMQENRHQFSVQTWIAAAMADVLNTSDDACYFVDLEPGHGHAWVSSVKNQGTATIDDVRLLGSGELLVLANVDLTLEVSVSADWEDCDRYPDIRGFFGGDCSGHPTAWVEREGNVAFTLTLNAKSFEVEWCDIDQIRCEFFTVDINPHPRRGRE